jgi:hypothetical protein
MSNRRYFGQNGRGRGRGGGGRGLSTYQRQMAPSTAARISLNSVDNDEEAAALARRLEYKRKKQQEGEALDEKFQFQTWDYKTQGAKPRRGWILNMITTVRVSCEEQRVCKEIS